jgi:lysophospholipase L1-like esterase
VKKPSIYLLLLFLILFIFELLNGFWFKSQLDKILLNLNIYYDVDIQIDANDYYPINHNISYSRNRYGLRTNCQDINTINFVSIGGSTTEQKYIDFEDTFSYILQDKLSKNNDGNFCIANAGVDGHNSLAHINSLENWFPLIPSFSPRFYLLNMGINDASNIRVSSENIRKNDSFFSYIKFQVISNSYLYSFIKKVRNLIGMSLDLHGATTHQKNILTDFEYSATSNSIEFEDDIIKNAEIFGENLKEIIKIIKLRSGTPICITQEALFVRDGRAINRAFPYKNTYLNGFDLELSLDLINNQIKTICTNERVLLISIDDGYFEESDFYDFVHHNPKGSAKLANLIYNSIKDQLQ